MQVYTETFVVRTNFVDIHKELHLYSLVNMLQDLAARHADTLGFGWDFLSKHSWFWVLTRLRIDILRHPQWKEKITVRTWPKGHDALSSYRDFIFYDAQDNPVIKATTTWIVLDRQTRRPVRMSQVFTEQLNLNKENAIDQPAPKIRLPQDKHLISQLKVLYTDLDMNLHMNNANYVRKILDAYPLDFLKTHHPSQLILNFLKETFHDETLHIFLHNSMKEKVHYLSLVKDQQQSSLSAQIVWEEKEFKWTE